MGRIAETNNYGRFELHEFNRTPNPNSDAYRNLEASFMKYGWLDSFPMSCEDNGNGKLKILRGHTRFEIAKRLGIGVKYVIEKKHFPLYEEGITTKSWTLRDYLVSYIRKGAKPYQAIKDYKDATGIPLVSCINLLYGYTQDSGNAPPMIKFKNGTFKLGDMSLANIVGDIIIHCTKIGVRFAKSQRFVNAVSSVALAKGFDPELLKKKIKTFPQLMVPKAYKDEYVALLDEVYNYHNSYKVPLKFNAEQALKKRNVAIKNK